MGSKLLWLGLTVLVALPKFIPFNGIELVGAALMIVGAVLLLLDK